MVYVVTGIANLFLAVLIFKSKNKYHPAELIGFYCLFNSGFILNNLGLHSVCQFKLTYIGAWTQPRTIYKLFVEPDWLTTHRWNDRLKFLRQALISYQAIHEFITMCTIMCWLFLAIDVVLVIKNPFYPKEWRVKMLYLPLILVFALIYSIIMVNLRDKNNNQQQNDLDAISNFIIYSLCALICLGCIIYSFRQLRRPGINRNMRL